MMATAVAAVPVVAKPPIISILGARIQRVPPLTNSILLTRPLDI